MNLESLKSLNGRILGKDVFVEKSKKVHGDKYDYSLVEYVKSNIKVKIICKEHGVFYQAPNKHMQKRGCPKCAIGKKKILQRKTIKSFMEDLENTWGKEFFLTDRMKYDGCFNKIKVGCKEDKHGYFLITPDALLRGQGCPVCGKIKNLYNVLLKSKLSKVSQAKNISAYVYIMSFDNFFKVGVSTSMASRVRQAKCELKKSPKEVKILHSNLYESFTIENLILNKYHNFSARNLIGNNVSGKTEFLSIECINEVLDEYNWETFKYNN